MAKPIVIEKNVESVTQHFHYDRIENMIHVIENVTLYAEDEGLRKDLYVFIIENIAKCCLEYYSDPRIGMDKKETAIKIKQLCENDIFRKAITQCKYLCLIQGTIGKK